jgi:hypothetical protein
MAEVQFNSAEAHAGIAWLRELAGERKRVSPGAWAKQYKQPIRQGRREEVERLVKKAAARLDLSDGGGGHVSGRREAAARADNRGRVDTPGDVSGVDPADTWTAAQEALAQFRELIAAGKMLEAQRAAISIGVLIDKSRILEERAAIAHERAVVLADDQAKMVVEMVRTASLVSTRLGDRTLGDEIVAVIG